MVTCMEAWAMNKRDAINHIRQFGGRLDRFRKSVGGSGDVEQIYMDQALKLCGNNVTKAAALLGITRFSMKRRLDKED